MDENEKSTISKEENDAVNQTQTSPTTDVQTPNHKTYKKRAISMIEDDLRTAQEQVKALEMERAKAAVEPVLSELFNDLYDNDEVTSCLIHLTAAEIKRLSEKLSDMVISAADDMRGKRIRDNERRRKKRKSSE